jgi:hypothetical protein
VLIAIAIHMAVAAAFLQALVTPRYFDWIFTARAEPDVPTERIRYVAMPPEAPSRRAAPRAATMQPAVRHTPTDASATPRVGQVTADTVAVQPTRDAGAGASTDLDDPRRVTLVPGSADPRIWSARSGYVEVEISRAEVLEGSLARAIGGSNDSIAALGVQTMRPEWIVGRDGRTFGLGNTTIHLGKVSVPAVTLGLLPIRGFGCMPAMYFPDRPVRDSAGTVCIQLENPGLAERAKRINEMSAEIRARATLAIDGRDEINRIAARKDRERAARLQAQQNTTRGESKPPCP